MFVIEDVFEFES